MLIHKFLCNMAVPIFVILKDDNKKKIAICFEMNNKTIGGIDDDKEANIKRS